MFTLLDIATRGYLYPLDMSRLVTRGLFQWEIVTPESEIEKYIQCIAPQYYSSPLVPCRVLIASVLTGNVYGDMYDYAVALRVCHWFALDEMNGGNLTDNSGIGRAGCVTSSKEGDLSESRVIAFSDGYDCFNSLRYSRYGNELIVLTNSFSIYPTMSNIGENTNIDGSTITVYNAVNCFTPQFISSPLYNCRSQIAERLTGNLFGDKRNIAVALRICHMFSLDVINGGNLTDDSGSGLTGYISDVKEGDLSEKRDIGSAKNSLQYGDLVSTRYGLELIDMINSTVIAPTMGGFCL